MVLSKDLRPFRYFRGTLKDGERVNHNPSEMTETTERLRMVRSKDFRPFRYFRGTLKMVQAYIIVSRK